MSFISEFKSFALRGNVADMAVGIIIGAAFGKIVSSVVNDIVMPPLGVIIGGVDFKDLKLEIKEAQLSETGEVIANAVHVNYGNFLQNTLDFIIVAFAIFVIIRLMNSMKKKEEAVVADATPPPPTKEEILLTEIRDLLKKD
jgi:large conductance mechanosensitive channel